MPIDIRVEVVGLKELLARMQQGPEVVRRETDQAMRDVRKARR